VGHLIDWAAAHQHWFARALTEPKLTATGYPEDGWLSAQQYNDLPWRELVDLCVSLNRLIVHVIACIPEEKMDIACRIGIAERSRCWSSCAAMWRICEVSRRVSTRHARVRAPRGLALVGRIFHVQVVGDLAEAQAGAGGAQTGYVLLHVSADYAFQSHMTVVDDDVDRRHGLHAITR